MVAPVVAALVAAQARLDGLIQAAHRHQADLERSELALRETRAAYAGDVRALYARGPLAPLELLLAAGAEAAGGALDRDLRALSEVGLATGTVRARVSELGATQAETLALRQRPTGRPRRRSAPPSARSASPTAGAPPARRPGVLRPRPGRPGDHPPRRHVRRPGPDVQAPHTGALVRVDAVRPSGYAGATRPRRGRAVRSG
jgi:hypothetical protein